MKNKVQGDKKNLQDSTVLIIRATGLRNDRCYSILDNVITHIEHENTGMKYETGCTIPCKTVKEKNIECSD